MSIKYISKKWKYYNHAALPTCAPHEKVDCTAIENGEIWNINGKKPLIVRWTSDFDNAQDENWWFLIKDSVFDISKLTSKKRYEINKGIKNFYVNRIDPKEYADDIFEVQINAFMAYPKKYRVKVTRDKVNTDICSWKDSMVYAAFQKETNKMCGYSVLNNHESYISFDIQKTIPEYEKYGLNAVLVYFMIQDNNDNLSHGVYICDGERNVNHETHFQDYLVKYFEFRRAYCNVHILFSKRIRFLIRLAYSIKELLYKMDNISIIHKINALLKMKEICDCQQKNK